MKGFPKFSPANEQRGRLPSTAFADDAKVADTEKRMLFGGPFRGKHAKLGVLSGATKSHKRKHILTLKEHTLRLGKSCMSQKSQNLDAKLDAWSWSYI